MRNNYRFCPDYKFHRAIFISAAVYLKIHSLRDKGDPVILYGTKNVPDISLSR